MEFNHWQSLHRVTLDQQFRVHMRDLYPDTEPINVESQRIMFEFKLYRQNIIMWNSKSTKRTYRVTKR